MRKFRGFKIGKRLFRLSKWIFRRARCPTRYNRLSPPEHSSRPNSIARLIDWGRRLTSGAKLLCSAKPGSGYVPVGQDTFGSEKVVKVPKGHLAVYVGQKDVGDFHRVLVPVIYFNHPLFGKLLKDAEEEYGFHHHGGITIPCRFSDFESVQTRIAVGSGGRKLMTRKRNHY